ncbi:ferredoxin [Castellaniella sp. S9]|uniref:ferredoxin n=1 Tax=Castellaniella sp. S9 TaxID=2993652 RepID=UPI0022B3938A|nr:ferredoxin [Castellaniella sp. S9]
MPHIITEACIDCIHKECVKECPVDCIYEGVRSLYIQPDECIDCGACVPACPEDAIFFDEDVPDNLREYIADNTRFFSEILDGKTEPLGSPGAAAPIGSYGSDTKLVAGLPERHSACKNH